MADTPCPFETFSSLALPNIRAAFIQRAPGVEVLADRQIALDRLKSIHLSTMEKAGFAGMPLAQAEQVHSAHVRIVTKSTPFPVPDCDALVTTEAGLCLGIYVADCAAVYLADKYGRGIALAHSGRKGTELGIVTQTIETLCKTIGAIPSDIILRDDAIMDEGGEESVGLDVGASILDLSAGHHSKIPEDFNYVIVVLRHEVY